jgi:Cu2+-exporting ATPase
MTRIGGVAPPGGDQALHEIAASLAAWSIHPLSRAIGCSFGDIDLRSTWSAIREQPGSGLEARAADGCVWRLGSAAFSDASAGPSDAEASVWLARDGVAVARFDIEESPRPDAAAALERLRRAGLKTAILSGDRSERTLVFGKAVGADEIIGGATPESKLFEIAAAQSRGQCVVMVGDGINDAPVLARADVSIAMGRGAELARSQADAVLMSDRVADVAHLHQVARSTMRVIRQNLVWAATYNAVCVPLAMAGLLPPLAAGLGMAASSLLVIVNSLRLAR